MRGAEVGALEANFDAETRAKRPPITTVLLVYGSGEFLPPGIQPLGIRAHSAPPTGPTLDGQPAFPFPFLCGSDVDAQVLGDLLP
jgi:hypothetical protein